MMLSFVTKYSFAEIEIFFFTLYKCKMNKNKETKLCQLILMQMF